MEQVKSKNNKIQILRAFAIIAVVLIHTCPPAEWQVICRPFINFSVATFLFLSGYLTKLENKDWTAFYKKRIIRVLIPYVIWSILYCISHKVWTPKGIAINLLTAKAAGTLYYIFVYIQFVLLTPFLSKLIKSRYRWIGWLIAPITVLFFKYYWLLTGSEAPSLMKLFWSDACLGWFIYYYLGLVLGNNIFKFKLNFRTLFCFYAIAIILNMIEGYWWLQMGEANCGTQIKLSSFLTSTVFLLIAYTYIRSDKYDINNNFIRKIGDYSFGIYLSHIMFMQILSYVPGYKSIPYIVNSTIVILISFIFVYYGTKILGPKISRWLGFI